MEHYGVEVVFGIPGVHTLSLYDALIDSSLRHVTARHEQGAASRLPSPAPERRTR